MDVFIFHICQSVTLWKCFYIMCICVTKGDGEKRWLYFAWLLQSARHPTGGVSINAVIYKWHALETSALSGRTVSEVDCLCTAQMQIIKIDLYLCVEAFHGTVAEKKQHKTVAATPFISWGDICISYTLGEMFSVWSSQSTYLVTILHHLAFSPLSPNCHLVSPYISAAQWGVGLDLEINLSVWMFAVILAVVRVCLSYGRKNWVTVLLLGNCKSQ